MDMRMQATVTVLHRLHARSQERFDDAVFMLVSRGIYDLDELEECYERRRALAAVRQPERRRRDRVVVAAAEPVTSAVAVAR